MRRHVLIAGGLVGLGVLALVLAFASAKTVRSFVKETYTPAGTRQVQGGGRSELYDSSKGPSATAREISDAVSPGDRRVAPAGIFLRYDKDIVSVVPREGGSRVIVEDERTGYRSGFLYLGGFWGTASGRGRGAAFRGGGPGGGK